MQVLDGVASMSGAATEGSAKAPATAAGGTEDHHFAEAAPSVWESAVCPHAAPPGHSTLQSNEPHHTSAVVHAAC
jgi:hypothetical protein